MADSEFLRTQVAGSKQHQVKTVNEFCDKLMREIPKSFVPYIAPHYDTAKASILVLSSNPGPKAGGADGSGFLSIENDDPSAERMWRVFHAVGLKDSDALPWNAFPWHVHDSHPNGLNTEHISAGLRPMKELLELHPRVTAIIAHGGDAHRSGKAFARAYSAWVRERGLQIFKTRHTSNRAFILSSEKREIELARMREIYRAAMRHVGLDPLLSKSDEMLAA